MEEKKKRFRPSLTAYRALQSENESLKKELDEKRVVINDLTGTVGLRDAEIRLHESIERHKDDELEYLINRGLWARIFNFMYDGKRA